ncbi:MAG TPA: FtsW/RodA/SpoVE family cell cycle protein [Desulfobacterales bacterium]|nr:FtsW/RodA/SpoVE family cell cycle protein [Desulfobacterales bacterium]
MKQWLLFFLGLGLLVILSLGGYRLAQLVLAPQNLFLFFNRIFILCLAVWAGVTSIGGLGKPAEEGHGTVRFLEFRALVGMSLLVLAAFVLAGQGRILAGKELVNVLPFAVGGGMLGQSLTAAGMFLICIWGLHFLLCKMVPGRDPALLPMIAMLSGIGLLLLFRLGPDIATIRGRQGFEQLFWSQFRSFLVSLVVFIGSLWFFRRQRLERLTQKRYIYALACILLIALTALFGTEMHGRRLSLNLGVMNFQTVELVKILALFFMVGYFRYEGSFLEQGRNRFGLPRGRYLLPYLLMWLLILLPVFLQRDLGPTALLFSLFLIIFYLGTGSAMSVVSGIVLMGLAGTVSYLLGIPSMVRTRVDMWLDPFHYSQNLAESLWAVAAGGLFGTGPGKGLSHVIPVVQSDFNFSVIAEEWGLIGVAAVLVLFGSLVAICLRVAGRQKEPYLQLLAAGLGSLWMLQCLVIVAGNMALMPLTGITLPFISFGGSSLVMNFVMLAMLMRLSERGITAEVQSAQRKR